MADDVADDDTADDVADDRLAEPSAGTGAPVRSRAGLPGVRRAMVVGLLVVAALAGTCGWLGYRVAQGRSTDQQRALFVDVAKRTAVDLTSIDYRQAEADVQRILDSSTGGFHDDFQGRSGAFIDVVKKSQSASSGTVTEAGLESMSGDEGQVLVAVTVMSSNRGVAEPQPRYWRMRLTVTRTDRDARVSRVDFP